MKKLLERIQELRGKIKAVGENEAATDEQIAEAEGFVAERKKLEARVLFLQDAGGEDDDDGDGSGSDEEKRSGGEPPAGSHFEVGQDRAELKKFRTLGHLMLAVRTATMSNYTDVDKRLLGLQRAALGGNVSVPSEGGFGVGTDFATQLLDLTDGLAEIAPRATQLTLGANSNAVELRLKDESSRVNGSRWGGVTAYWVDEATTVTPTKPKIRKIRLELDKLMALYYTTDEELRDAGTLSALAMIAIPDELSHMLDNAVWSGDGVSGALGVLSHASSVTVAKVANQTAATVNTTNIMAMWARMPHRNRANAVWMINQDVEPSLFALSWTDSAPAYWPPGGISGLPYGTLFGRPVIAIEQASTVGTVGDIALIDWTQYLLIKKEGLRQDSSMHVQFLTDQMCFRFILRANGVPLWTLPLTPQRGSNTQSPFVFLAVRG